MSHTNNTNNTKIPTKNIVPIDLDLELPLEIPQLKRETTIQGGPRILTRDADIYILMYDDNHFIIKSYITDQPVANRRYNKETGYVEKIDPSLEEEDRRLLITALDFNAVLAEDYYRSLGY